MPSTNKTEKLGLNQWVASDKPTMTDFNNDNKIIEEKVQKLDSKGYLSVYPNPNEVDDKYKDLATIRFGSSEDLANYYTGVIGQNIDGGSASLTIRAGKDETHFRQIALASNLPMGTISYAYADGGGPRYGKIHNSFDFPVETGTWQPSLFGSTTAGTVNSPKIEGYYVRHGSLVFARGSINAASLTGASGEIRVGNLPFVLAPNCVAPSVQIGYNSMFRGGSTTGVIIDNSIRIYLGGIEYLTATNAILNTTIWLTFSTQYHI